MAGDEEAEKREELKELQKRRGVIKSFLTHLESNVRDLKKPADSIEVKGRLDKLEENWVDFNRLQGEIETILDEATVEEDKERQEFEDRYFALRANLIKATMRDQREVDSGSRQGSPQLFNSTQLPEAGLGTLLNSLNTSQLSMNSLVEQLAKNAGTSGSSTGRKAVKLAPLTVPSFNGNHKDWVTFRDLYVSIVHDNAQVSTAEKFQLLRTALTGDALSVIQQLPITEANYEEAWQLLQARFDKKKFIVEAHLKSLTAIPALTNGGVKEFRKFVNSLLESVRALKTLEFPVDQWDCWILFLVVNKLDPESKQLWARETAKKSNPSYEDLTRFLEERLDELETLAVAREPARVSTPRERPGNAATGRRIYTAVASRQTKCPKCDQAHRLHQCPEFARLTLQERYDFVKGKRLCFNCFSPAHRQRECNNGSCRTCQRRHHTLLHRTEANEATGQQPQPATRESSYSVTQRRDMLLPTAVVLAHGQGGTKVPCRVLMDSGSTTSLARESFVQRLGIPRTQAKMVIYGIGDSKQQSVRGKVELELSSRLGNATISVGALILQQLTADLPRRTLSLSQSRFTTLQLADPQFDKSGPIDLLLGADAVFEVLRDGRVRDAENQLIAQNSAFGWLIAGQAEEGAEGQMCGHISHQEDGLDQQLRAFWEIEEPPIRTASYTPEEEVAMQCFEETTEREADGRFKVQLPFKKMPPDLGESRTAAVHRLKSMERRFKSNPGLEERYAAFMREYLEMGHMKGVSNQSGEIKHQESYYLPHHAVVREDSLTTKLRVVFDASRATSTGASLNNNLLIGPTLQRGLIDIMVRFRRNAVAFVADIEKMFRQIKVHESHVPYQRIVWRFNPAEPIQDYELQTVTYGTASAPFLSTRCLMEVARTIKNEQPDAARVIQDDFYMDDCLSGAGSAEEAIALAQKVTGALKGAGFPLRKWKSNSEAFLKGITETGAASDEAFQLVTDETTKILGILWYPKEDCFSYKAHQEQPVEAGTKRQVLSYISRLYDPLGLAGPAVMPAKLILQGLWLKRMAWDDPLDEETQQKCLNYFTNLPELETVRIPRWLGYPGSIQLHGFADASERAYGGVVYARVQCGNVVHTRLLLAKGKVAPIKQISVPRLELCGAHLLTKLITFAREALEIEEVECYAYTDSTVVLHWLADHPTRWKTFIGNRTSAILQQLPANTWRHVPTAINPADCLSRGMTAEELVKHELWWHGPAFLKSATWNPPTHNAIAEEGVELARLEERPGRCLVVREAEESCIRRFSSYARARRVVAWILRFKNNTGKREEVKTERVTGCLKLGELEQAKVVIWRTMQRESFEEDLDRIQAGQQLARRSTLISLNPFIDSQGILRVGGRLEAADIAYEQRHPPILHRRHPMTWAIVRELHKTMLHAGARALLAALYTSYWVIGARILVRQVVARCTVCTRYRGTTMTQQMAALPKSRVNPGRPFANTGVDYGGPISLRTWKGRSAKTTKGYICLFVCLATKAVHLEAVSELTTEAFLAALRRFISRRGYCHTIWSDNGTNFVGAARELKEVYRWVRAQDTMEPIVTELAERGIEWRFIPPAAPHFGGLWEAGIKSVKHHLRRVMGNALLTFEEFATLLAQIEACLNSRPLAAVPTSAGDPELLTPNHFLLGGPAMTVPELPIEDARVTLNSRWRYVQALQQTFWKRWINEYLHTMQARSKWPEENANLKEEAVVILKDDPLPKAKWRLGRVTAIHPGKRGQVRVATIKTTTGVTTRTIDKLVLVPIQEG